jgi:hypothetical protein
MMTEVGPVLKKGDLIFNKRSGELMRMVGSDKDLYCHFRIGLENNQPMFVLSILDVLNGINKGELFPVDEQEKELYQTLFK